MTYTCHTCKTVHTEWNMVAHCAACYSEAKPVMPSSLVVAEALAAAEADGRPWMQSVILAAALRSSQAKLSEVNKHREVDLDHLEELAGECNTLKARLALAEKVIAAARSAKTLHIGMGTLLKCGCRDCRISSALAAYEKGE